MTWRGVSMPKTASAPLADSASPSVVSLEALLERIAADYPTLAFVEDTQFAWHAGKRRIAYKKSGKNTMQDVFSLLHELGHALLAHLHYGTRIATPLQVHICEAHISRIGLLRIQLHLAVQQKILEQLRARAQRGAARKSHGGRFDHSGQARILG